MTQKDNVKQLIGKSLNAYNNKVLQQIDRIEKKNKQQNHKISMLTNELDNDYLTKKEEGSVISLEHSKEGMVYIDSLEGNTLVNYCTDGSKELTLNGDIDLEGTFVTTTEGVDNGKVDVMCEGNTLVNLIKIDTSEYKTIGHTSSNMLALGDASLFRNGIQYTIICEFSDIVGNARVCFNFNSGGSAPDIYVKPTQGLVKNTFIMPTEPTIKTNAQVRAYYFDQENSCKIKNLIILEGDWTDREIPPYFEGMQSVGEDDKNGHKIEILSQNTIKVNDYFYSTHSNGTNFNNPSWTSLFFKCKPNTTYTVEKLEESNSFGIEQCFYNGDSKSTTGNTELSSYTDNTPIKTFTTKDISHGEYIKVYLSNQQHKQFNVFITESSGNIDSLNYKSNKKEILLNEPLRGLPNGVKDRFVKIGGKFYIERNCGGKIITKDTTKFSLTHVTTTTNLGIGLVINKTLELADCFRTTADNFLLEGFVNGKSGQWYEKHWGAYSNDMNIVAVFPPTYTLDQMKDFIDGKQIIYKLKTPTYEPLEINPELICYNDTTHISNNSLIPCTMKIKNSGYNAIIKPSTLYTIALDTNKSGTIGMNLGGVKGITANNVLTLTTPATLSDDSLRLYGKDIKGSKVRLLEGDKTSWIPSFFEGMKSSFEDKFDATDNTYKMEISSGNENKITKEYIELMKDVSNYGSGSYRNLKYYIQLEPQTIYTVSCKEYRELAGSYNLLQFADYDSPNKVLGGFPYQNNSSGTSDIVFENRSFTITTGLNGRICFRMYINNWTDKELVKKTIESIKDLKIEKGGKTPYVEGKSNKIQFSSIEPLRGVDDVKDKFVLKDGKLMLERNCGKGVLGGEISNYHCWNNNPTDIVNGYIYYNEHIPPLNNVKTFGNVKNNLLPSNQGGHISKVEGFRNTAYFGFSIHKSKLGISDVNAGLPNQPIVRQYFNDNPLEFIYQLAEPTYEEIPFELQKIILEGYENGTLFFDTNIPPTSTVTYAGETPIVKSVKLNKTEVLNNTTDINDNIIPYLMDMDYRVVCLELATETQGISMARLFGGVYEMLKRDILSGRLSKEEYGYRLADYFNAGKLTEEQVRELEDLR